MNDFGMGDFVRLFIIGWVLVIVLALALLAVVIF